MYRQKKPISPAEALAKAEALCNRAEHCSSEIREKLIARGISPGNADIILKSLARRRLIDDSRFARMFAQDKVRFSGWGKRKISLALTRKHIDRDNITEALQALDTQEYNKTLEDILTTKARFMPDADTFEGRTKLFRFAVSRGFEPDLAASAIRQRFGNNK